ncbi:MAG: hypothetical protein ABGY75_11815 [Gemmataceae bacterium]
MAAKSKSKTKSLPLASAEVAAPAGKGSYAFVNEEANAAMNDVPVQPKPKTATTFSLINP